MTRGTTRGILVGLVCLGVLSFATIAFSQDAPSPPLPSRVRVSAGVLAALRTKYVQPKYPSEARSKHVEGSVVMRILVARDGKVSEVNLISGDDGLAPAAMDAVKQWKYKPYLLNGEPVEVEAQVTINFTLAH